VSSLGFGDYPGVEFGSNSLRTYLRNNYRRRYWRRRDCDLAMIIVVSFEVLAFDLIIALGAFNYLISRFENLCWLMEEVLREFVVCGYQHLNENEKLFFCAVVFALLRSFKFYYQGYLSSIFCLIIPWDRVIANLRIKYFFIYLEHVVMMATLMLHPFS